MDKLINIINSNNNLLELDFLILVIFACISPFLFIKFAVPALRKASLFHNKKLGKNLVDRKVFVSISYILPPLILNIVFNSYNLEYNFLEKILATWLIVAPSLSLGRIISVITDTWKKNDLFIKYPIRSYLQLVKLLLYIITFLLSFCQILDLSPWGILSGIGAIGAILILVFKDTILGLVASIQVYGAGLVKEGDWIELKSMDIDGEVIEAGLHRVRVKAWDNTIVTFPTAKFLEQTFKNWRGMQESGGRRIKRSIIIDQSSIKFLDKKLEKNISDLLVLKEYLVKKNKELSLYNSSKNLGKINRRTLTNIGCFRAYMQIYLEKSPNIKKNMTIMIRQLKASESGLPLEVYAFTNITEWLEYEKIQSDLFDHFISIAPYFDLSVFQKPSTKDIELFRKELKKQ